MAYLDIWRRALPTHLATFQALLPQTRLIDKKTGILASALLWHVKKTYTQEDVEDTLREICGDALKPMLRALDAWDADDPLIAADWLQKRAVDRPDLQTALNRLLLFFMDDLIAAQFIKSEKTPQTQNIDISGTVQAGIVNIGGTQFFWGDVVVNVTYVRQHVITCPTAPNPPTHFTGRKQELDDLRAVLEKDQMAVITAVRSMGGMGKTSLAQALCHQPEKPFDAVLWASIGQEPQVTSILLEWARYAVDDYTLKLDAKPEEIAGWVRGQLTQLMHGPESCGTRWLVVFDDVWDNQTCYAALRRLKDALPPGVKTLITTRQAETAIELNAKSIELYELNESDALALLHRLRDNRHLTEAHLKRATALIKGHPLTLELAIASLNKAEDGADADKTLDDYERGIRDGSPFDALDLETETPRILNVVFGRSYNTLPQVDQAHFRALGILASDAVWRRLLAGAVWGLEDEEAISDAHKALRLRALIQQVAIEGETGAVSYHQHPLLRSYARALLNAAHESETVFERYADYIVQVSEQFITLPPEQWNDTLGPLYPHILYVGDDLVRQTLTGTTGDLQRACDFATNITRYLANRREIHRIPWLEMGLQAVLILQAGAGKNDLTRYQKRETLFLNDIGGAWAALGDNRKALDYFEQALPLRRAVGDRGGEATTLNNIGGIWSNLGEQHKALDYYEQALPLYQAVGDRSGEAITLTNIGLVWKALGVNRKALKYYEQALHLHQAVGDRSEATTLNNIGTVWSALGDNRKALEYYEQALHLHQAVGDRSGEATTLTNIGAAWHVLGKTHKALDHFEQVLPLYRAVGDRGGEATTLNNMGYIYFQAGNLEKTIDLQQQVIGIFRAIGAVAEEASCLLNIGAVYQQMGHISEAIEAVQAGKAILLRYNLPQSTSGATLDQCDAMLAQLQGGRAVAAGSASSPTSSTLPDDTVQTLAQNTYAVKTGAQDQLTQWHETLSNLRMDWVAQGEDYTNEVAFSDALFALLDDQTPVLPADNPYADVVQQVIAAIQSYHDQGNA